MLAIAGGILIAVAILAALPLILRSAFWALVIGVGLVVAVGTWLLLASVVGQGWAMATLFGALAAGFVWADLPAAEKTAGGLIKSVLIVPAALLTLLFILGVGFAAIILAAVACMGVVGLFLWVFGPIGAVAGALTWIVLCYRFHHWWRQRPNRKEPI